MASPLGSLVHLASIEPMDSLAFVASSAAAMTLPETFRRAALA
jgi:hypothetical protein